MQTIITQEEQDSFFLGYRICALWASVDDEGYPLDDNFSFRQVSPATRQQMIDDCNRFINENAPALRLYIDNLSPKNGLEASPAEYAGHDFWLTRIGSGAGFWDNGDDEFYNALDTAASKWSSVDLYVGDDGLIYS